MPLTVTKLQDCQCEYCRVDYRATIVSAVLGIVTLGGFWVYRIWSKEGR